MASLFAYAKSTQILCADLFVNFKCLCSSLLIMHAVEPELKVIQIALVVHLMCATFASNDSEFMNL